ncbi:uncharacterized protein ATNIH1004_002739 [Aspergillus tanneri]|uniref:Uncharacterized protein n=1 Tax=Aspergillus tanneri TaxID=1220188 RepID=A0A5M9MT61_9EURO|nr:uncharacterized protein ATNIH1004_002739 [Aspergillus tanneri]KAA8650058.1 hypothetical protein ATNIH1004_002739 [Aspergillus tanneri]
MNPPLPSAPQGPSLERVSYQAPTKASLARYHSEALGLRTEARVFGLRDRKALRPSLTGPTEIPSSDKPSPISFPSRRSSGLQAFAAPPRRVSRRIVPSDLVFHSPPVTKTGGVDIGIINTPDDQLASELGSATGDRDLSRELDQASLHEYEEPDLPPTPTQLGLEKPLERPKGLLSSSPTAQQRGRRRATDLPGQSPSKLRNVDDGIEIGDLSDSDLTIARALLPKTVSKKRKLRKELSAEVQRLKEDLIELERWSQNLDQHGDTEHDLSKLISLLASESAPHTGDSKCPINTPISSLISTLLPFSSKAPLRSGQEPSPINPFALNEYAQTKSFLTIFAPLTLKTHSSIVSGSETGSRLERHTLTFFAPPPFPSSLYTISIIYETDLEQQTLVSVSVPMHSNFGVPADLQRWINSRLANSLLKLDVSGLCWGINRYWEVAISRACLWSQLEDRHMALFGGALDLSEPFVSQRLNHGQNRLLGSDSGGLTTSDLRRILPHLQRTSMLFESKETTIKVLFTCELTVDEWTGEAHLTPELTVSCPSSINGAPWWRVELESKSLFNAVVNETMGGQTGFEPDANTVTQATDCLLASLFGANSVG